MTNEKSAVILSPKDPRDFRVGGTVDISGDFPKEYAVWQPPVEDQGETGNCVAQTLANVFETWRHREGDAHEDFSVGYVYGVSDAYGMIPRDACAAVCREGDVLRSVWECFLENPACHLQRAALPESVTGRAVRMSEYVRIYSFDELRAFMIKTRLPVMLIAEGKVFSPFCSGYHAVACYGWDKDDKLLYTNSWGVGGVYGDGRGKVDFKKTEEIWGVLPVEEKVFKDVKGHWAEKYICDAAAKGIVNGYEDGTFKPDKPVTRAEVAAMLARLSRASS